MKPGKIVISVHSDFVWKVARITFVRRRRRRYYYGNLDNVVCVAEVLRSVMPRVRDKRIKFYFTTAEEESMAGAKEVMRREGKALYIPIDVTQASKKADVNVEWPFNVNKKELKRILARIKGFKIGFKTGHKDETQIYGKKYPTFSLNLPIEGNIHGKSCVSFYKARRFGRAVAEILKRVRMNYEKICMHDGNQ
ncbi:MAG: hypothetical protein QXP42_03640 [Candidatus Micrarchaeia archaeon]